MTPGVTKRRSDTFDRALILCGLLLAAELVATGLAWPELPREIASHWSSLGRPNGHSGRAVAWTPGLSLVLLAGLAGSARHPALSRRELTSLRPLLAVVVAAVLALLAYGQGLLLVANYGRTRWEDAAVPAGAVTLAPLAALMFAALLLAAAVLRRRSRE